MKWNRMIVAVLAAIAVFACRGNADAPEQPELIPATASQIIEAVKRTDGKVVLVNVWATWCKPCKDEFPAMLKVAEEYHKKGLRLMLVSADFTGQEKAVRAFLRQQKVTRPSYFKRQKDQEFIDTLCPEWSGALPATFLFNAEGTLLTFWEGEASEAEFETRVKKAL